MDDEFKVPVRFSSPKSKMEKQPAASAPTPTTSADEPQSPEPEATPFIPSSAISEPPSHGPYLRRKLFKKIAEFAAIAVLVGGVVYFAKTHKPAQTASSKSAAKSLQVSKPTASLPGVQLVANKNYGNKYSTGVLPIGDGKYVIDAAKAGYIYACSNYASNIKTDNGGAGNRGPWFSSDGQTYDLNKKLHVQGSVNWAPSFTDQVQGATRTIMTNDLPNHPTGTFPISSRDPAYVYDRNPNSIKAQVLSYSLNVGPTYGPPQCMGGQAGVMLTGVALFNGFDAGGRDAGAWEVQDNCNGHPEKSGIYHYHTLSSCIKDVSVKTVIGFALDGFPITGPQVGSGNILTTADLDECHGLTGQVVLDGKTVTVYHYVMTQDFPYSVSCFRSTPIQPPGQPTPR